MTDTSLLESIEKTLGFLLENEDVSIFSSAIESSHPNIDFEVWQALAQKALDDLRSIKNTHELVRREEFPKITSVDLAIAAADEGFMSCKGARLMSREIEDLRALLCRASRIMSGKARSRVTAEEIWRKDLNEKGLE